MSTDQKDDLARIRRACTRFVAGHGERGPAAMLAAIGDDVVPDDYGDGGVVEELEVEIAGLLGMEAALFLPSGTMGQQIVLRVHADRRGRRAVAFHPECHLDNHEGDAYRRLHQLIGRPVGDRNRLVTLADLESVAEPMAALLLELPQREIGGQLPAWDDLTDQITWARDCGAATHLDGARLWQCGVAYGRELSEIAGLFDTVYVSFYKDLGALAGCCVAGPRDVIAEVAEWRRRHGGAVYAMWPYAASALTALRDRLPKMGTYRDHAQAIASDLSGLDGVRLVPEPPHTSMLHLHLRVDRDRFLERVRRLAESEGIWTWSYLWPGGRPDQWAVELTVGDATLGFEPAEIREIVAGLVQGG